MNINYQNCEIMKKNKIIIMNINNNYYILKAIYCFIKSVASTGFKAITPIFSTITLLCNTLQLNFAPRPNFSNNGSS